MHEMKVSLSLSLTFPLFLPHFTFISIFPFLSLGLTFYIRCTLDQDDAADVIHPPSLLLWGDECDECHCNAPSLRGECGGVVACKGDLLFIFTFIFENILNFSSFQIVLFLIWLLLAFPLTILGTIWGRKWNGKADFPCQISKFPRPIPPPPLVFALLHARIHTHTRSHARLYAYSHSHDHARAHSFQTSFPLLFFPHETGTCTHFCTSLLGELCLLEAFSLKCFSFFLRFGTTNTTTFTVRLSHSLLHTLSFFPSHFHTFILSLFSLSLLEYSLKISDANID